MSPARLLGVLALLWPLAAAAQPAVEVRSERILLDGQPFALRGAAGKERLAELKALGATTLRTFGEEGPEVLREAEKLGLKVIFGFWLEHPRRGFDYGDRAAVQRQLDRLRDTVLRHRDSPALLMWGLGNEVEAELTDDRAVWPAIGEAARLVKSLDPARPRLAVLAEVGGDKVARLMAAAPDIDVLGVNSYGEALPSLPERVRAAGWRGPLVITELGAHGQWQAEIKPWGAFVELTSTEKAARLRRYLHELAPRTAGQIVFLWGQKQEVTPTWHSLFLPTGEWTEGVQVMAEQWGGTTPGANRAPRLVALELPGGDHVAANAWTAVRATGLDPDGDGLQADWTVMAEARELGKGGDLEPVPSKFPQAVRAPQTMPGEWRAEIGGLAPGAYRIFVTLRDGRGAAAVGNLPFLVR